MEDRVAERALPLSMVFDRLQEEGQVRDRDFVRRVCAWLHERADRLELRFVEELKLVDVVVTFKMRDRVSLVVTGYPSGNLPGEVTVTVHEDDFPRVQLGVREEARSMPYELCTMDYGLSGYPVMVTHKGEQVRGTMIVASTIGTAQNCRVKLESGETITAVPSDISWVEVV